MPSSKEIVKLALLRAKELKAERAIGRDKLKVAMLINLGTIGIVGAIALAITGIFGGVINDGRSKTYDFEDGNIPLSEFSTAQETDDDEVADPCECCVSCECCEERDE